MPRARVISLDTAQVGQQLAEDVVSDVKVLLAAGTVLTKESIEHLKSHGVEKISALVEIEASDEVALRQKAEAKLPHLVETQPTDEGVSDFEVTEPLDDLSESKLAAAIKELGTERNGVLLPEVAKKLRDLPTLHNLAQAYTLSFDEFAHLPQQEPTEEESWFSKSKESLREEAGLSPAVPCSAAVTIREQLSHNLATASFDELPSLVMLDEVALMLQQNANLSRNSYLVLDDITVAEDYVGAHVLRTTVSFLKSQAASGLSDERCREFTKGIVAHNLGLAKLLMSLLNDLDAPETILTRLHDAYKDLYHRLRRANGIDESVLELVFLQNEHCDGDGFPYKLSGDSIPFESRMLAIASRFSQLTLSKPRFPRLTPRDALIRVLASSGKYCEPQAIHSFVCEIGVYPTGSLVRMADGRNALVVRQNRDAPLRPVVRPIERNASGEASVGDVQDLRSPEVPITEALREF